MLPKAPCLLSQRTLLRFGLAMRYSSLVYWCLLSLGLLTRDPTRVVQHYWFLADVYWLVRPAVHFLGFALLTVLVLSGSWRLSRRSLLLLIALYAAATELIQGFIPGRSPEWADLAQDLAGLAAGWLLWWVACRAARLVFRPAPAGSTLG